MNNYFIEALKVIETSIDNCSKMQPEFRIETAQVTLLKIFWENTEKFLKTYWQIVNTVLFYVHKKTRTELKFGYFSLGSTV